MLIQVEMPDLYLLTPMLGVVILLVLMVVMFQLYVKARRFLPILVVFLFSIIIGMDSLAEGNIPFTPYFQIFFIMFQSVFFLMTSIDLYKDFKKG